MARHGLWRRPRATARWTPTYAVSPRTGPTYSSALTDRTSTASCRPITSRKWNGSAWSAIGSNTGGTDGWFPAGTYIYALTSVGSNLFATGAFQNANGDGRADNVACFDGTAWNPVGSNGAGNGPWVAEGPALALVDRQLYAAGNFTSAGGDTQAQSVASFSLTADHRLPDANRDPGSERATDAHGHPQPDTDSHPDVMPPATSLRRAQINQATRKATFRFASGEPGSTFSCKLDKKKLRPLHLAEDLQEARARQARVPRQGARPRRQPRHHTGSQAVQDQGAIAAGDADSRPAGSRPARPGTSAFPTPRGTRRVPAGASRSEPWAGGACAGPGT